MASEAQIAANRENSLHSTGPKTSAGKEASSQNRFRHGLTGHGFAFLEWENPQHFDLFKEALRSEHRPTTATEEILVEKMAQHHWLSQRAQTLQTLEMKERPFDLEVQKNAAVYLRYQLQHDRLFQRALHDLLKLRAEKRKAEIGFERERRAEAQEVRRESEERRKDERHKISVKTLETKLEREVIKSAVIKAAVSAPSQAETGPESRPIAA